MARITAGLRTTLPFSAIALLALALTACSNDRAITSVPSVSASSRDDGDGDLDSRLSRTLDREGFTGQIEASLPRRLHRNTNPQLADIGRLLFFDVGNGLNGDNSCAGCHNPRNGFGDSQSIAIGIENNFVVGPDRRGPRNQRRTPVITNIAFYPALMWNSRFHANSGDPFDNSRGFTFPPPESNSLSGQPHLLNAQAFIPPTERVEMAGFVFPGGNQDIRNEVIRRLNTIAEYRSRFGKVYARIRGGGEITYDEFAAAVAEFEFTLTFANAPIDEFARGHRNAMSNAEKRGALLFFGRANCSSCHAVGGQSNEMFSDFRQHVIGVPQIVPSVGNVTFDGAGANEDFGLEQVTGDRADRYMFRTSPLRNVSLQRTFMHNGAFTTLEDAIQHHLDVPGSVHAYSPATAGVAVDLRGPLGPMAPVLERLDPRMRGRIDLSAGEFRDLVQFVRTGLLDPRTARLPELIPTSVPSGKALQRFQ